MSKFMFVIGVDVILSHCVISLAPDKMAVFRGANPDVELVQLHGNEEQAKLFSARVTAVKPL